MTTMRHDTLAERAYEELRGRIISGRLPAGQRLLAEELAGQLAISQTPVKEALAALARDGLVEGASRRASTVRRFTRSDMTEIYDARILVETDAVRTAIRNGRVDAALLAGLRSIHAAQSAHAERRTAADLAEAIRLDREFHEAIVGAGGNAVLAGWHRVLLRQTQTIRSYSLDLYDGRRARLEHGAILEALEAGNAGGAARAIRAHLTASRDEMLSRPPHDLPLRP